MTHKEFVIAYNKGKILVHVNRSLALQLMNSSLVSKRFQIAHIFWTWIWILSIPAAIICFVWIKWWIGLIIIVIGLGLTRAIKEASCQNILDQVLEDKEFYELAIKSGTIVIEEKNV